MNANRFLTAEEVAARLQVSPRTIYLWVDQGLLRAIRVGPRLIRFTEEGVDEFLARSQPERA
jgi:excisionase family DNA binding protein